MYRIFQFLEFLGAYQAVSDGVAVQRHTRGICRQPLWIDHSVEVPRSSQLNRDGIGIAFDLNILGVSLE